MTADSELFTIEQSKGKERLTRPRSSDLGTVETGADRDRDHDEQGLFTHGNQAAKGRGARRAIKSAQRAARQRLREAVAAGVAPSVADQLLADALAIHHSAIRELGTRSVFVEGPAIAYATESVLAGYFMQEAAKAGLLTKRGLELHQRAMACETQAQRAMTAALAATKVVGKRRKQEADPHKAMIEAFGQGGSK